MLAAILKETPDLEIGRNELDDPISIKSDGGIATVGELIVAKAPPGVVEEFRAAFADAMPAVSSSIIPVTQLDRPSLKLIAVEILKRSDPDYMVASLNGSTYTDLELIADIEQNHPSSVGEKLIRGVRLNGIFVENAINTGKVRPRTGPREPLTLPKFDF